MSKSIEEKRIEKANKFIVKAKDEFKKYIPRDTITDIGVTSCSEKDGTVDFSGSVATTSPTGKLKSFGFDASVAVDEKGKCALSALKVFEIG